MSDGLTDLPFGPYFATPCGILAPLLARLEGRDDYMVIAREDNAVGEAAGAALCGAKPVVLMQNSGFGNSVNALASLVAPYRIPMLLIVSMRGTHADPTPENAGMGKLTEPILQGLGIGYQTLEADHVNDQLLEALRVLDEKHEPYALLVRPDFFGWSA
ncbi:thiamine pyrophosphate-binding protein [Streptomyces roseochromogenus]|uniref:thiamine pyrophosphate-binding protein n=1 Tax=Streptomyces roseochromogenus TaxID=285450 RepID=UPI00131A34CF|nr:thiamine pyrophosphate-binding protein [Streptomyces roseochromogenus]